MFESLSDRLQNALAGLKGRGKLTDKDIDAAMREIRLALLEADVNFKVVREFVDNVKERALGAEVMESLTPAQQFIKIVNEELTALMGVGDSKLTFGGQPPTVIMMVGLQGSGKTTACGKLAKFLMKDGKSPVLIAGDVYRPAAIDQLDDARRAAQRAGLRRGRRRRSGRHRPARRRLGAREGATCSSSTPPAACTSTRSSWTSSSASAATVKPHNILLVLDAMTGQDAVNVAEQFQREGAVRRRHAHQARRRRPRRRGALASGPSPASPSSSPPAARSSTTSSTSTPTGWRRASWAWATCSRSSRRPRVARREEGRRDGAEAAQAPSSPSTTSSTRSSRSARWARSAASSA